MDQPTGSLTLLLQEKEHLVADVWAFRFKPSEPLSWTAGQYLSVELPHDNPDGKGTKRWFTISSAPYEQIVQITTRLTGSTFKDALMALPIGGQLLLLDQPHGEFVWQDSDSPLVFVAGGIGITSFRSILRERAHQGLPLTAHLIYGNRTTDIAFKEEFDAYAQQDSAFSVSYVIGEPLTVDGLLEHEPRLLDSVVYISGPTAMAKSLGADLVATGLLADHLKQDFYPTYTPENY